MKTTALFASLFLGCQLAISQQQPPAWEVQFENPIESYHQAPTGLVMIFTDDALHGIDPIEKKKTWTISGLQNLDKENYTEIPNTSYAKITGLKINKEMKGFNKLLSKGRTILIDNYKGRIIYDSDEHPIKFVQKEKVLQGIDAIFILGRTGKEVKLSLVSIEAAAELWTVPAPEDVRDLSYKYVVADPAGNLLLYAGKKLVRIDGATGDILWEQEYSDVENLFFQPNNVEHFYGKAGYSAKLNCFDLTTGLPIWFDVKLKIFSKKQESTVNSRDATLMKESETTKANENIFENLRQVWPGENDFMARSSHSFNFLKYEDAKPRWDAPARAKHRIRDIEPLADGGFLVKMTNTQSEVEHWYLDRFDSDGQNMWDQPYHLGNYPHFCVITDHGLVYMDNFYIGLLDAETGRRTMQSFKFGEQFLPYFDWERGTAAVFHEDKIYEIDFAERAHKEFTNKIKFRGDNKDFPNTLEWTGDGYFLANDQNLMHTTENGGVDYIQYHKAVGTPAWLTRAAAGALRVAITSAVLFAHYAGTSYAVSGYTEGDLTEEQARLIVSETNLYANQNSTFLATMDLAFRATYLINSRTAAGYQAKDYQLVLTKFEDKGIGLLKLEKETGDEIERIELDDKSPEYFVDDFLGVLYFMPNKKTLSVYEFAEG